MDPDSIVCPGLHPPFEIIPREAGSIDLGRASNSVSSRHSKAYQCLEIKIYRPYLVQGAASFPQRFTTIQCHDRGTYWSRLERGVGTKGLERERHVSGLPFRLKLLVNKFVASDRRIFHGPCKKRCCSTGTFALPLGIFGDRGWKILNSDSDFFVWSLISETIDLFASSINCILILWSVFGYIRTSYIQLFLV